MVFNAIINRAWVACLLSSGAHALAAFTAHNQVLQEATIKMIRTQEVFVCFVKRSGPQLRQEKVRRPQNLSLLNDLEPPPLSLSLAPYI